MRGRADVNYADPDKKLKIREIDDRGRDIIAREDGADASGDPVRGARVSWIVGPNRHLTG